MKKLLLLSLLSFTHFMHPVSAKQVAGGLAFTAGAGNFVYCLYKQSAIDAQIKKIKAQLNNANLNTHDRTRYTEELHALIARSNKNELITLGSLAACGAGYYMLMPSRPNIEDAVINLMPDDNQPKNVADAECPICFETCTTKNLPVASFWTLFGS